MSTERQALIEIASNIMATANYKCWRLGKGDPHPEDQELIEIIEQVETDATLERTYMWPHEALEAAVDNLPPHSRIKQYYLGVSETQLLHLENATGAEAIKQQTIMQNRYLDEKE